MAFNSGPTRKSARLLAAEEANSTAKSGLNSSGIFAPQPADDDGDPRTSVKPFRFLELPGGLRTRIYSYAVQPKDGVQRNLRNFKQPSITAFSKLVREESLPVLFSDCGFKVVIGSNALMFLYFGPRFLSDRFRPEEFGTQRGVNRGLREIGDAAILRDVTFLLSPVPHHHDYHRDRHAPAHQWHLSLHITTQPKIAITTKRNTRALDNQGSKELEQKIMIKGEAMVQEIGKTEGFKGLRLVDVDRIAKCFRVYRD